MPDALESSLTETPGRSATTFKTAARFAPRGARGPAAPARSVPAAPLDDLEARRLGDRGAERSPPVDFDAPSAASAASRRSYSRTASALARRRSRSSARMRSSNNSAMLLPRVDASETSETPRPHGPCQRRRARPPLSSRMAPSDRARPALMTSKRREPAQFGH